MNAMRSRKVSEIRRTEKRRSFNLRNVAEDSRKPNRAISMESLQTIDKPLFLITKRNEIFYKLPNIVRAFGFSIHWISVRGFVSIRNNLTRAPRKDCVNVSHTRTFKVLWHILYNVFTYKLYITNTNTVYYIHICPCLRQDWKWPLPVRFE